MSRCGTSAVSSITSNTHTHTHTQTTDQKEEAVGEILRTAVVTDHVTCCKTNCSDAHLHTTICVCVCVSRFMQFTGHVTRCVFCCLQMKLVNFAGLQQTWMAKVSWMASSLCFSSIQKKKKHSSALVSPAD